MIAAACLSVALGIAKANAIELNPEQEAKVMATCQMMAAVPVRAIREDHDGRLSGCTALASVRYRLPPDALPAILFNEGGWVGAVIRNKDGSTDHGPFQVNSQWMLSVKTIFGYATEADAAKAVTWDSCINPEVAAIILARCRRDKGDLAKAIGCYASPTPKLAEAYIEKIVNNARTLKKRANL